MITIVVNPTRSMKIRLRHFNLRFSRATSNITKPAIQSKSFRQSKPSRTTKIPVISQQSKRPQLKPLKTSVISTALQLRPIIWTKSTRTFPISRKSSVMKARMMTIGTSTSVNRWMWATNRLWNSKNASAAIQKMRGSITAISTRPRSLEVGKASVGVAAWVAC